MATRQPKTLGGKLRRAAKDSGRSGYDLAKQTGLNEATLSRFMRGMGNPRMDSAELLAKELGFTIELVPVKGKKR